MSALLINETFLNTFLRTQQSGFALKSVFLSGFTLLRAFLSAQKSAQGPAQPLCTQIVLPDSLRMLKTLDCVNPFGQTDNSQMNASGSAGGDFLELEFWSF